MNKKIVVDIYSDYVCPFCYMGKVNLENAIKELKMEDEVEVNFKAYELDEQAPKDKEMLKYDSLVENSEKPIGVIMSETREVIEQAKDVGLEFNYDIMLTANTRNAHKLTKYAKTKGKQKEFATKVMEAYFTKGANLNSEKELVKL
ncbi:DsbA family protein, partial [Peptostreptococcaceae bacterium OttesenSCG-928-C18]|nr:DsbA family protein [Peptostreptococcaceae bacterium OttesenSCG-928-C18]